MATSPYFTTSNQYILYDIHVDTLSQSVANNSSTVKVKVLAWRTNQGYSTYGSGTCYVNIDGVDYSAAISSSQVISYESDTVLFEETVTINHDPDGKKQIYVSAYIDHSQFNSNSQGFNVVLTTIPRQATIISAPNFSVTDNPTIKYSNPARNAVTSLQVCLSFDNSTPAIAYRDVNKKKSSYTFNLTDSERVTLLAAMPNTTSKTIYYILKTVIGGSTYYSKAQRTVSVSGANPLIEGASYQDTNAATIAITGNNQKIIQNNSSLSFNFTSLTAGGSATLTKITVTIDGVTKSVNLSGSSASNVSLAFGTINSANNVKAAVVLTDSRGNTAKTSLTITVLAWQLPSAIVSLWRKDNFYDTSYINVNADYASLDGNNAITIQYQYKRTTASSYGVLRTLQDGVTASRTLDNSVSYDFKVIVSDLLGSTTYYKTLQIGIPIFFIDKNKRSIGVGTMPKYSNHFCIDGGFILANLEQEELINMETTVIDSQNRTAYFLIKNNSDNILVQLNGQATGGNLYIKDLNNTPVVQATATAEGGEIKVRDPNNVTSFEVLNSSLGGMLGIYNHANNIRVVYADSDSNGGRIWLLDTSNNANIKLNGGDGKVTAKTFRQSDGLTELYNGSLSTGNTTFSGLYSALVVVGRVKSGGALITATIPVAMLSTSAVTFQLTDEQNYITYNLSKNANNVITLAIGSLSSTGTIEKVYGML